MIARLLLAVHQLLNLLIEEVENLQLDNVTIRQRVADGGGGIMGGKQNVVLEKLYLQIPELVINALM